LGTVTVSLPSDGTTADVADYNTPITTIVNEINGNLDNDNIKSAAAIAGSKLADNSVDLGAKTSTWDGWVEVTDSWAYASATTVTVPSDATTKYSVGDKVKFDQSGTKYFYIIAVSATTLTLFGGSDYTVANAAISSVFYSKVENPQGFPQWFNATTTHTGFSAAPTYILKVNISQRMVTLRHRQTSLGTSNSTSFSMLAPITSATVASFQWGATSDNTIDNTAQVTTPGVAIIASNTTTITLYKTAGTAASWTASGGKALDFTLVYQI
jgi:hypothetical protein